MDILRQIITMDKAAAERVENTVQKHRQRNGEFGENSARELEELLGRERKKAESRREAQEKALAEKRESSEKALADRRGRLEKCFEENGAAWRSEIVKRITEG